MVIEGKDGVTHINVYSKAKTEIGKWLSNFTYSPFIVEWKGKHHQFASVEAAWYWWITGIDNLKGESGFSAKQKGEQFEKIREIDEEFIKKCIDEKLKNNYNKMVELANTFLPLCHYYEYGSGENSKRVSARSRELFRHCLHIY